MNNDLISRQYLLEHLEEEEKMIYADGKRFKINKDVLEGMKQNIHAVMDYVKEADVAYDIDKVLKQLEENASRYTKKYITPYGNNGYRDTKAISIHKAIEIVKQGGVAVANNATVKNDDVCEWEYRHPFGDFPGCKNVSYFVSRNADWNYCPYCGKKIKVVK